MKALTKIMRLEMMRSCLDVKTLAKRANLSVKTVYKVLHGGSVRAITIARIASVLDIDPLVLIDAEGVD